MRPLEILLVLFNALALLFFMRRNTRLFANLVGSLFVLMILHGVYEGIHWQMVPVYLAPLLLLGLHGSFMRRRPMLAFANLSLLLVGVVLMSALPIAQIPKPEGPYPVGTISYALTDGSREEIYTEEEGDVRQLMAQVWYPAAPTAGAEPVAWLNDGERFIPALARSLRLPAFFLNHLTLIKTHSYAAPPLAEAEGRYPVLVYVHGWQGFRTIATQQMETLASHGYIVVALDHTYGSLLTVFEDGRVVPLNPGALPSGVSDEEYDRASERLVQIYAEDVRFLLGWLEQQNQGNGDPRFAGRLALAQLGLYGHSTGGGAVVRLCASEPRCIAGAGLDAWVEPVPNDIIQSGMAQPFLFIRSEEWTRRPNDARLRTLFDNSSGERYLLAIQGTAHRDFTLQPLLSPLTTFAGLAGTLDEQRTFQITDDYLLAFFDHTLRGTTAPLLESSPYPEVEFERQAQLTRSE